MNKLTILIEARLTDLEHSIEGERWKVRAYSYIAGGASSVEYGHATIYHARSQAVSNFAKDLVGRKWAEKNADKVLSDPRVLSMLGAWSVAYKNAEDARKAWAVDAGLEVES